MALSNIVVGSADLPSEVEALSIHTELYEFVTRAVVKPLPPLYPENGLRFHAAKYLSVMCHNQMVPDRSLPPPRPLNGLWERGALAAIEQALVLAMDDSPHVLYTKFDECFHALEKNSCMEDGFANKEQVRAAACCLCLSPAVGIHQRCHHR